MLLRQKEEKISQVLIGKELNSVFAEYFKAVDALALKIDQLSSNNKLPEIDTL